MTYDKIGQRVVIIGGGITGTLVAREMSLQGWSVTLLEGSHVGAGSSSRTAAGIRQQFSTPDSVRSMRYSVDFYKNFANEVEGGQSPIHQSGYLFLVNNEAAWQTAQARVLMQQQAGLLEVEAIPAPELRRRFPWVSETIEYGATWCPSDGFLLPTVIYQQAAQTARNQGARLISGARVDGCSRDGDRLVSVNTPSGVFEADLFIDCTNAWTRRLSPALDLVELPVDPIKRYLWFLKRGGDMSGQTLSDMPLVISPSGVYARPENADQLLMGWAHAATPEHNFAFADQDEVEPRFSHQTGVDAVPFEAWMNLAEAIPAVGEFDGITATTCGYYGSTPDHNPFIGFDPNTKNCIRIVGFSGHGAMFGPFSALAATTLASAGRDVPTVDVGHSTISLAPFKIGRRYETAETMVL